MSLRNLLYFVAITLLSYVCYVRAEQNPYARYVAASYSVIDRWSLVSPPDQELFDGAMNGMIEVLNKRGDEHSMFVDQLERDNFQEDLIQEFGGIGVRILQLGDPPQLTVIGPPEPGSPAFSADIRAGDRIVAIDGQPTDEMKMRDVLRLVRGAIGSPVTLSVIHPGEKDPTDVKIVRAVITVESVFGDLRDEQNKWQFLVPGDNRIGYVRIAKFGDKTLDEFTDVLAELNSAGIKALILDVRDNYGGTLDAAVGISDLFLRAGQPIVTTRDRDGEIRDRFVSTGRGGYHDLPLAVLINHNSASASEILAACLQDYNRAVIIGERSYGKGTVQRIMQIESGRSLLKLTSATYWRPSGQNIHRMADAKESDSWGVKPDAEFEVLMDEDQYLTWRKYRYRRDLLGEHQDGPLAIQFDEQDGKIPEQFTDEALDLAVGYLESQLNKKQ
ncbi:S41 family peptidase [Bythopirellula polymerisocia]|uniref:Carboxy-terminal processing protease CtpB n=1 Tax=Bythopirellula polymerisocia TaxID=2528003 RepID=A0A5C6CLJ9_9BACT|nr:S41 family peptidase [Bythopirellula polymerisocia]TWU25490.1 Carboxy-terminal processing protease CtpB precursor [Bythopirellula polymerisocia]